MRVKIGNKWYDSQDEPVCVQLSDRDKRNIANMPPDAHFYATFPDDHPLTMEGKYQWMDEVTLQDLLLDGEPS